MEIKQLTPSTALVVSDKVILATYNDAVNLIGNSMYFGVENIIVEKKNIRPTFFDLSSGLAGEVLQKFSTYKMKLAIVGDFSEFKSKSLKDFIYESNKTKRIIFVSSIDEALFIFG